MQDISAQPAGSIEELVRTHGDMLYRICLVQLGSVNDAEDAVQETVLACLQKAPAFKDSAHEKAWLIRVATNKCRDMQRFRLRHPQIDLGAITQWAASEEDGGVLEALMALPEKFRIVLTLHYVEGYSVKDIAKLIGKTPSAVKMRLQKGRRLLEAAYRKEYL